MNNLIEIQVMTTSGCHLCDDAVQMFNYLVNTQPQFNNRFCLNLIEIANDDYLLKDYGIRIPVLKAGEQELGWIFTLDVLDQWLQELI